MLFLCSLQLPFSRHCTFFWFSWLLRLFSALYYWLFKSFLKLLILHKNPKNSTLFRYLSAIVTITLAPKPVFIFCIIFFQSVSHFLQYHIPLSVCPTCSGGFTPHFYSFSSKNSPIAGLHIPRFRSQEYSQSSTWLSLSEFRFLTNKIWTSVLPWHRVFQRN